MVSLPEPYRCVVLRLLDRSGVVQHRPQLIRPFAVQELNDLLDELCKAGGNQYALCLCFLAKSPTYIPFRESRLKVLHRIYLRASADEQRWIVRIILKGAFNFVSGGCHN